MADDELTHLDSDGNARMVDVGDKPTTVRTAVASGRVVMQAETMDILVGGRAPKGDVLAVARVAAIQAAKRTADLIPLCHTIALTGCEVEFTPSPPTTLDIEVRVRAADRTGAEMEALTAVSVAALTVYDMLKAVDRGMSIEAICLQTKSGGARGDYQR